MTDSDHTPDRWTNFVLATHDDYHGHLDFIERSEREPPHHPTVIMMFHRPEMRGPFSVRLDARARAALREALDLFDERQRERAVARPIAPRRPGVPRGRTSP
jgi:hypothetical protein